MKSLRWATFFYFHQLLDELIRGQMAGYVGACGLEAAGKFFRRRRLLPGPVGLGFRAYVFFCSLGNDKSSIKE